MSLLNTPPRTVARLNEAASAASVVTSLVLLLVLGPVSGTLLSDITAGALLVNLVVVVVTYPRTATAR